MKNVIFTPWVGRKYSKNKNKILILGESHYSKTDFNEKTDFTTYIINLFLSYKKGREKHQGWMNTFTRFTNILNDKHVKIEELENFWNSVMFYNYVQKAVKGGARVSPSSEDFAKSHIAFLEVLKEYKPNVIIVWGDRLWNNIPNDYISFNEKSKINNINNGDVDAELITIYHPSSSAFSYDYWKKIENKPNYLQFENIKALLK